VQSLTFFVSSVRDLHHDYDNIAIHLEAIFPFFQAIKETIRSGFGESRASSAAFHISTYNQATQNT
jgi:hypothetical protein